MLGSNVLLCWHTNVWVPVKVLQSSTSLVTLGYLSLLGIC